MDRKALVKATGIGTAAQLAMVVAGHFIFDRETDPGVAFTIAVIALAGKMAKADGQVSDAELDAFHRVFRVSSPVFYGLLTDRRPDTLTVTK